MQAFTLCCLVVAIVAAVECAPNSYGYSAPASYATPAPQEYLPVPADQPIPIYPSLLNENFAPATSAPLTFLPPVYAIVSGYAAQPPPDSPLYVELPSPRPQAYSPPAPAPAPARY